MSSETTSTFETKLELITRGLHEIIGIDELTSVLKERDLNLYLGTSPTGRIHIGYLCLAVKIADFIDANCNVTILIADLHAYLDSMKSTLPQLKARTEYYRVMFIEILKLFNVNIDKLKFVVGTDFQLSKEYTMDMYRANSMIGVKEAMHAGAEVVKQSDNPSINGLIYPTLQALDEQYLKIDGQFAGVDQRKIMMHARNILPKLGYKKNFQLMMPMVPSLSKVANGTSTKMSSSDATSKIDLLDTEKDIKKKVNQSYCLEGDIKDNTPLILVRTLIFPILKKSNKTFVINRNEKYGGKLEYAEYKDVENDFETKKLFPADLKLGIIETLSNILQPLRTKFQEASLQKILNDAYPK